MRQIRNFYGWAREAGSARVAKSSLVQIRRGTQKCLRHGGRNRARFSFGML
jgi:hypothetical protein